jgi:hypothetical protein
MKPLDVEAYRELQLFCGNNNSAIVRFEVLTATIIRVMMDCLDDGGSKNL